MLEIHPYNPFVPKQTKHLLLGSFVGKEAKQGTSDTDEKYDWYYGTKRNQFWPILRSIYERPLETKNDKQKLFVDIETAVADIIYQCERKSNSNLDANLTNVVYADRQVTAIVEANPIDRIFFTSRFVEQRYRRHFQHIIDSYPLIALVTLPSPSPRFTKLTKAQKIARYRELLPAKPILPGVAVR